MPSSGISSPVAVGGVAGAVLSVISLLPFGVGRRHCL
jgi:hypothetical protein